MVSVKNLGFGVGFGYRNNTISNAPQDTTGRHRESQDIAKRPAAV